MKLHQSKVLDRFLGGLLIFLCKLPVLLAFRKKNAAPERSLMVMKLLGGGSLSLAFPGLLGLKNKYPGVKFTFVATRNTRAFGEALGIFDDVVMIDDSSFFKLVSTGVKALFVCRSADTFVNLEFRSKLCGVFTALTGAPIRVTLSPESDRWMKGLFTHLVPFSQSSNYSVFYDQIARDLGTEPAAVETCLDHIKKNVTITAGSVLLRKSPGPVIGLGHGCSDLCTLRMLTPLQWRLAFQKEFKPDSNGDLHVFGVKAEGAMADAIIAELKKVFPRWTFTNRCGSHDLKQTLNLISQVDTFFAIDSSLIHFARLMGIETVSYWGPTDPNCLLRKIPGLKEKIYYKQVSCSPCVHVHDVPPCGGNNVCIKQFFEVSIHETEQTDVSDDEAGSNPANRAR